MTTWARNYKTASLSVSTISCHVKLYCEKQKPHVNFAVHRCLWSLNASMMHHFTDETCTAVVLSGESVFQIFLGIKWAPVCSKTNTEKDCPEYYHQVQKLDSDGMGLYWCHWKSSFPPLWRQYWCRKVELYFKATCWFQDHFFSRHVLAFVNKTNGNIPNTLQRKESLVVVSTQMQEIRRHQHKSALLQEQLISKTQS